MRLPDTFCPECHGDYELRRVAKDYLVKRCTECGHSWHEEREVSPEPTIRKGGYIWRNA